MPSFTLKSLPVVLLVGASALAGPITRDQNDNNSGQGGCIEGCTLINGVELCNLDWQSIFDQNSDYCPAGIASHEEFMPYARTCRKAMDPDFHDDGKDCSDLDLCPLLRSLGGNSGPYGPGNPPFTMPYGPANGDPGIKPQSEQGGCPNFGLCPLIHDVLSGSDPLPVNDPGSPSTRPYENGQPGQSNDFRLDASGPYGNNRYVMLHAGDSSSQARPVDVSNDGPRIVTLPQTDRNDPQNDHHLDITGNDNGSSRNLVVHAGDDNGSNLDAHANDHELDVQAGNDNGFSRNLDVRPSVNNNNQQDPQRNVQNGINVNVDGQPGQNGLVDLRGPRNTDGENGECQQK